MTYEETLAHIFSRGRFGIKPGLERIRILLQNLGNPHHHLRIVHIAGTNGKGSTAVFLAAILEAAGFRTGLYTSPHLIRFTERIRINGREISEESVTWLAGRAIAAAPPETTFFELVTAMALLHFAEQHVDVAILEAGMGGRSDATSVAEGILSVITPISLDHCDYLGSTISEIAEEKAGIVREGRPAVVAPQLEAAHEVIARRCRITGSRSVFFGEDFSTSWDGSALSYSGLGCALSGMKPGIGGRYQSVNAACALAAAELLANGGFSIQSGHMAKGIEQATWPGRMELFSGAPRVLLDGAHNQAGAAALAESLVDYRYDRLLLVIGVMADKDVAMLLRPLLSIARHVYAVSPAIGRALPSVELARIVAESGIACTDAGTVSAGVAKARSDAGADDLILVCGSLFTVGEARAGLLGQSFTLFRG